VRRRGKPEGKVVKKGFRTTENYLGGPKKLGFQEVFPGMAGIRKSFCAREDMVLIKTSFGSLEGAELESLGEADLPTQKRGIREK